MNKLSFSRIGIFVLSLLFILPISCTENLENLKSNETQIEELISGFYEWYSYEIKAGNTYSFQPKFTADSNGMSTLDFSEMNANLAVMGFHENYILELKKDFKPCLINLKTLHFDSLVLLDDLDDFENINCAFSNVYQWTKEMEPHDGVEVEKIIEKNDSTALAECRIFNVYENMRMYWEHKYLLVKLKKINEEWKISNIEIVFP